MEPKIHPRWRGTSSSKLSILGFKLLIFGVFVSVALNFLQMVGCGFSSACLLRLKPVGDAQPEILPEKQLKLACPNFSGNINGNHQWRWVWWVRYSEFGTICCKKLKLYVLKNHHDVEVSSWEAFSLRSPATKLAILCFASWFFCFGVAAFVQIFCQESNVQPVQLPVVCFVGIKFLSKFCWCHCDLDNVGCAARTDEDLWRHPWCRPKHCFSEFDHFGESLPRCVHHSFLHKISDQRSILRHAWVVQYRWRNTSALDRQVTNVLPYDVSQKTWRSLWDPPWRRRTTFSWAILWIEVGDFKKLRDPFDIWQNHWKIDPWIWRNQDTTVSKLLSFWCSWSFDIRCLP